MADSSTRAMADSSAATSVTSTGAEFAKKVAHSQEHVQQHLIISAVFALVVNFVSFCATLKKSPAWLGLTPCTFQTEDVASGITSVDVPFNKAIALLKLVPMIALIISIGRNWRSGLLDKPRHFPFKIVSASWLWTCTTVLLAYSLFNVKVLTPHESIAEKSCNVGLSQLYFPNLTSGDFQQVEDSVKAFRGPLAIGYFANTLNLRVSDRHPNLEANLDVPSSYILALLLAGTIVSAACVLPYRYASNASLDPNSCVAAVTSEILETTLLKKTLSFRGSGGGFIRGGLLQSWMRDGVKVGASGCRAPKPTQPARPRGTWIMPR